MNDCHHPPLDHALGNTTHRYLEAGAGLTTETPSIPPSDGGEDRGGCSIGVDAPAQLQILPGGESRDLANIGNDALEGVAKVIRGRFDGCSS